ncbi:MAG: type II toxin-antitoxin system ParD family antitoxin [Alphaproteobacteria bacterium]
MPTRNIVLTDRQEALIDALVRDGRYQNASEVLRDGLRMLEATISRQDAELEEIRAGILESLAQAERGAFAEGSVEDIFDTALEYARRRAAT